VKLSADCCREHLALREEGTRGGESYITRNFVIFILYGSQMWEDEMGGMCSTYDQMPLVKPESIWKANIEIIVYMYVLM
jgi:hypothetical protein